MAKNKIKVSIGSRTYTIVGDDSPEHIVSVGQIVDENVKDLAQSYPSLSISDRAVLAAVNVADDFLKTKEKLMGMIENLSKSEEVLTAKLDELNNEFLNLKLNMEAIEKAKISNQTPDIAQDDLNDDIYDETIQEVEDGEEAPLFDDEINSEQKDMVDASLDDEDIIDGYESDRSDEDKDDDGILDNQKTHIEDEPNEEKSDDLPERPRSAWLNEETDSDTYISTIDQADAGDADDEKEEAENEEAAVLEGWDEVESQDTAEETQNDFYNQEFDQAEKDDDERINQDAVDYGEQSDEGNADAEQMTMMSDLFSQSDDDVSAFGNTEQTGSFDEIDAYIPVDDYDETEEADTDMPISGQRSFDLDDENDETEEMDEAEETEETEANAETEEGEAEEDLYPDTSMLDDRRYDDYNAEED